MKKFQRIVYFLTQVFVVIFFYYCDVETRWDSQRIKCKKELHSKMNYCSFVFGTYTLQRSVSLEPSVNACIFSWALELKKCDDRNGFQYTENTFYFRAELPEDPNKEKKEKECIENAFRTILACYLLAKERYSNISNQQSKSNAEALTLHLCYSVNSPFACVQN